MPGRAVSPIRFFDPILNNALALRASQYREAGDVPTGQAVGAPPRFGWRHRGDTLTQAFTLKELRP